MISVDLDRASILQLLRVYFTAPRAFKLVTGREYDGKVSAETSPSGVGFHVMLHADVSPLEDLKIRALLWDDPVRIAYALRKWTLNPSERHVDLRFDEKSGGKVVRIPLDSLLSPYASTIHVQHHVGVGEGEKAEREVKALAEKLKPEIDKYKTPSFIGCISFKGDELHEALIKVCGEIAAKDQTFKWRIYPSFMPEWDWILSVFTTEKEKAWKRITWLKNRAYVLDESGSKRLILKDAETRLWVKERKAT